MQICLEDDITRQPPLQARDDNPTLYEIQASRNDPQPVVPHMKNKRRFGEQIDDGVSGFSVAPSKPVFYKNKTAMRAPRGPKCPDQERYFYNAISRASKPYDKQGEDSYNANALTPAARELSKSSPNMKKMKTHYVGEIQRGVSGSNSDRSGFSFLPKRRDGEERTGTKESSADKSVFSQIQSVHHTADSDRLSETVKSRTIYDVTHPSRAVPLPPKVNPANSHGLGRTIYDVHHPGGARKSQRLAGKKAVVRS
ncbi:uncharacterized protein BT62DRAFT_735070 [Guyanagaster necrorhizus]|uniref:Uncharacterized protein n=1 Tax=Guyanagaster necrorhizus TaxID=856835 RepID=A0A9P7VF03_9AGAR|nr:uncharacterized protein BT62DRAFT_735070 [Guyanagaster necrorhizus MCA 3950]KAG7439494.1 hypothetical protein BT62DRAFT_735070 [Guyanagaster necrorhizus MCA 3950]